MLAHNAKQYSSTAAQQQQHAAAVRQRQYSATVKLAAKQTLDCMHACLLSAASAKSRSLAR
jgi:hypothetical protein